jgi:hypothetical protein
MMFPTGLHCKNAISGLLKVFHFSLDTLEDDAAVRKSLTVYAVSLLRGRTNPRLVDVHRRIAAAAAAPPIMIAAIRPLFHDLCLT